MKYLIKKFLSTPFSIRRFWKNFLNNSNICTVLSFHRILPVEHPDYRYTEPELVISDGLFAEYIKILFEMTEVLDSKKFVDWIFGRHKAKKACSLITFDDGWKDVVDFAAEPLKKFGLPAIVFVCPASIESGEKTLWFEESYRLILKSVKERKTLSFFEEGRTPKEIAKKTLEKLKRKSRAERKEIVLKLRESVKVSDEPPRLLCWDDLKKLIAIGVEPHCHTLTHEILTCLSDSEIQANLEECKRLMLERVGFSPKLLAYPNGEADERVAKVVKSCGFEVAFTTQDARVERHRANPLFIPRRVISNDTTPTNSLFVWKLLGLP